MRTWSRTAALVALALFCAHAAPASGMGQGQPASLPPPANTFGIQVLTRGPIHEAFAEPVVLSPIAGPVLPFAPPPPINEVAPEMGPATPGMVWIPGYWAWDQDRNGFIWVSGVWRMAPPNCGWVPGYWNPVANGFQWAPGFWLPGNAQEVTYFPTPPTSKEAGPTFADSNNEHLWIPGCWMWQEQNFAWRAGYYAAAQDDWIWIPAHYAWTPRGFIFIDGYWDYPLSKRGVLFAPVAIDPAVYAVGSRTYSPWVVLTSDIFDGAFFTSPACCSYYFGDYYDSSYANLGIYPWSACHEHRHHWYDPIYAHREWRHHGDNPHWDHDQHQLFTDRQAHPGLRPARTYEAQQAQLKNHPELARHTTTIGQRANEAAAAKNTAVPLARLSTEDRSQHTSVAQQVHSYTQQRSQWEGRENLPAGESRTASERVNIPASPVHGQTMEHGSQGFPSRPEAPAAGPTAPTTTPTGGGGGSGGHR